MTKRQAVRKANEMAGLRPQIMKGLGPKWDSFQIEFSDVFIADNGDLIEVRRIER